MNWRQSEEGLPCLESDGQVLLLPPHEEGLAEWPGPDAAQLLANTTFIASLASYLARETLCNNNVGLAQISTTRRTQRNIDKIVVLIEFALGTRHGRTF